MSSYTKLDDATLEAQRRESRVVLVYVLWSIPIPFIIIFTGLRLHVKISARRLGFTLDDLLIVFASVRYIPRDSECPPAYGPPLALRHCSEFDHFEFW